MGKLPAEKKAELAFIKRNIMGTENKFFDRYNIGKLNVHEILSKMSFSSLLIKIK